MRADLWTFAHRWETWRAGEWEQSVMRGDIKTAAKRAAEWLEVCAENGQTDIAVKLVRLPDES